MQYFDELIKMEPFEAYKVLSLYQAGILSQWKKDNEKAKGFYDEIINNVKSSFQQTVALTKLRLEEVNGSKELEYNLKTFLDIALSKENSRFDMSKTGLRG